MPLADNPTEWWHYSFKRVRINVQSANKGWSWKHLRERGRNRDLYISLYKKKQNVDAKGYSIPVFVDSLPFLNFSLRIVG